MTPEGKEIVDIVHVDCRPHEDMVGEIEASRARSVRYKEMRIRATRHLGTVGRVVVIEMQAGIPDSGA